MPKRLSLSNLLKEKKFPHLKAREKSEEHLSALQLKMLRVQQGIWHQKRRAVIVFEGFDAAGKGGVIRRLVESLDPRGYRVYPIGAPNIEEQGKHYLYRFWNKIPSPGMISIFDRSWYGRVLVEKVEELAPKSRISEAYAEILDFENTLKRDGVDIIKVFLAIDKAEQLRRFEQRLNDPYKQWKLTIEDVKARLKWDKYVEAVDEIFKKTSTKHLPWYLIGANDKHYARVASLSIVTDHLADCSCWMVDKAERTERLTLKHALKKLGIQENALMRH